MKAKKTFAVSFTSPAAASTVVSATCAGLSRFDWFQIDANLVGGTGGTLDIYLQKKIASDVWADWVHFAQISAAGTLKVSATVQSSNGFTTVGIGTDASPGVALAAGSVVGGHPGDTVRVVCVAGVGTSVGGASVIYITGFEDKT